MALTKASKRIDWHQGFTGALRLDFRDTGEEDKLTFEREHLLNKQPLRVDVLVIKKQPGVQLKNQIGRFFRGHNLFEYKSPDDTLNLNTLCKCMAYALLYKSYEQNADDIRLDDITVTLVRNTLPRELIEHLNTSGYSAKEEYKGIYRIESPAFGIPVQILTTKEMDPGLHSWLNALQKNLTREQAERVLVTASQFTRPGDRNNADAVLSVVMAANPELIQKMKEEVSMCEALRELMAAEIEEELTKARIRGEAEGRAEGRAEGEAKGRAEGEAKGRAEGEAKGRAEGEAKGRAKNNLEIATKMLKRNLEITDIQEMTGLSLDTLKVLAKENSISYAF